MSDKKKVFLITSIFPYSTGEEFIQTEILYWSTKKEIQLIILPLNLDSHRKRNIPYGINLDISIAKKITITI